MISEAYQDVLQIQTYCQTINKLTIQRWPPMERLLAATENSDYEWTIAEVIIVTKVFANLISSWRSDICACNMDSLSNSSSLSRWDWEWVSFQCFSRSEFFDEKSVSQSVNQSTKRINYLHTFIKSIISKELAQNTCEEIY